MTATLLDRHSIRAFLDRLQGRPDADLRDAFVCEAIETGGNFTAPTHGRPAVIRLHRITAVSSTEPTAITDWLAAARTAIAETL